jgi:L-serine deaminase
VFWGLFGSTATVRTVCFAYLEEVCFVISMAKLKLVEGTGSFPSCSHRDPSSVVEHVKLGISNLLTIW